MASADFERQMQGYGLTTAHILYHMPDFRHVLQTFVWQFNDLAPEFPELRKFLAFWEKNIEGRLHSVRYAHQRLIGPSEWRRVEGEFFLN